MDHPRSRRKWVSSDKELCVPINAPSVKEEVPPQYQHYLELLQERNRLMRRLRKKDKKQIELEKKEKGFTLYLNSDKDLKGKSEHRHRPQRAKTAGAADRSNRPRLTDQEVSKSGGAGSKTREKRRNWHIGSVEFTTADGQRQRIKPPEILSGKYQDDFEDYSSDDQSEVVRSMSSLDLDDDVNSSTSSLNTPRKKTSYLKRVAAAKREEIEIENRVSIRMEDVKKLRESLQMNKMIRQSLAMDADSEVEEEIGEDINQDDSDGERISPINEEIEEMIDNEDMNGIDEDTSVKPLKLFKPGDTLVLEFQPPPMKSKRSTNLAAARKKSEDDLPKKSTSSPTSSGKTATVKDTRSKQGSISLTSNSKPLSANRKSSDKVADSTEEARAVLKAMEEEKKKVELFSKVSSRPLPQPKSSSSLSSSNKTEVTKPPTPVRSTATPEQAGANSAREAAASGEEPESPIENVIKKVLKLNPRQQKQLLQTLNHIDIEESGIAVKKSSNPLEGLSSSWSSKAPVTDMLEVTVEVISNWGHSSLVGLTELQFYDQSGCLVPIKPSDVSVHGARGSSNNVEVLFNGKSKTTKERNMWSCKFDGYPIEFSILLNNPTPGKPFSLGSVKVWNWNNKISNLDIGARNIRIFFGGELLFSGDVDKGCGNQVFDYSKHIILSSNQSSTSKTMSKSGLTLNIGKAKRSMSPAAPTGTQSPGILAASPKGIASPKGDGNISKSGSHHTFRSISRSSASSASSSGSHNSARFRALSEERSKSQGDSQENAVRSETRTLMRPTVLNRRGSGGSSPDVDLSPSTDVSKMPEKKRAQTPMKTKRVAAKLNGRSTEGDNASSKSNNADSFESKPPLPPTVKSDEKPSSSSGSRAVDRSSSSSSISSALKPKLSPKSSKSDPHISPRPVPQPATSASQSKDKKMDKSTSKEKTEEKSKPPSVVDKIKDMGQNEQKRKKDIPTWLKDEEDNFNKKSGTVKEEDHDIQKQLDEEFEKFSQSGKDSDNKSENAREEDDKITPMKKIEKSRAKWRKQEELEESWGSLSFFNKSQRGRLSIDMGDDELDEYLTPSQKPSASQAKETTTPKLPLPDDSWSDEDGEFTIPELPSGRELIINIKTTWGDHHYVGLTGVQVFSQDGEQVQISKVWANPSDINILPEYTRDPRVVTNVIDNVNRTRDDVHMWLAPFTAGNNHLVYMTFAKPCKIALMRIWNYNKSRIHSFRGAKDVIITLDGAEIFKGEIARACGGIEGGTEAFGDTILFTTDEDILEAVSKNDDAFEGEMFSDDEEDVQRPSTANADDDTRPFTRAAGLLPPEKSEQQTRPTTSFVTNIGDVLVYKANKLELLFTSTWGDHHYLGLTGLEVVGQDGDAIPLSLDMITAQPRDLRHLQGNEKDDRTLDKLLDGTNVTCHDSHMWLIPFTEGEHHSITIDFPEQTLVSALRIWNYNKSPEDTYRGAKVVHVKVNDKLVTQPEGYLLRKGPGVCHFDFAQEIIFGALSAQSQGTNTVSEKPSITGENYESVVQMPRGFIFQLQLYSTWGDQYYIGLNGLEFYDASYNKIELTENNISAYPDSVNVLDNVSNDARTPDKLIDGVNDTMDGRHMWLAPILPTITNRVYVIFDQPTSVSMIKIWNYSKTVNRGVKDFGLLVDDLLVYNGCLQAVSGGARGILPTCPPPIPHHTVLFSDNKEMIRKEKNAIISNQAEDQDIQLLNDTKVVSKFAKSTSKPVNQALRPKTSVTKTGRR